MFSFYGDTVVDPFCGSGTTMQAAYNSNRNSIGVEVERRYCKLIADRMESNNNLVSSVDFMYISDALPEAVINNAKNILPIFLPDNRAFAQGDGR